MTIAILVLAILGFIFLVAGFPTKRVVESSFDFKFLDTMTGAMSLSILIFIVIIILSIISIAIKGS